MKQLRAELWTKWRALVSEQSQSSQTVSAFCRERGLRDSLFYDWKKRIREVEAAKFVEVKVKDSSDQKKPVAEHYAAIEVRLSQGRSLLVEPGFDASHLRALLTVLETEA
jgi:hypothetical protein